MNIAEKLNAAGSLIEWKSVAELPVNVPFTVFKIEKIDSTWGEQLALTIGQDTPQFRTKLSKRFPTNLFTPKELQMYNDGTGNRHTLTFKGIGGFRQHLIDFN